MREGERSVFLFGIGRVSLGLGKAVHSIGLEGSQCWHLGLGCGVSFCSRTVLEALDVRPCLSNGFEGFIPSQFLESGCLGLLPGAAGAASAEVKVRE